MSKWFKHDQNAHTDPKVEDLLDQEHGLAKYGLYWLAIEIIHERYGELDKARLIRRLERITDPIHDAFVAEAIDEFLDTGMLILNDQGLPTHKRIEDTQKTLQKRSDASRKANAVRWSSETDSESDRNRNPDKTRQEEIRQDKIPPSGDTGGRAVISQPPLGTDGRELRGQSLTIEQIRPIAQMAGAIDSDVHAYFDMREADGWFKYNREGKPRIIQNAVADCRGWMRDRVRDRQAGKLKEPKGAEKPAVAPTTKEVPEFTPGGVRMHTVPIDYPHSTWQGKDA